MGNIAGTKQTTPPSMLGGDVELRVYVTQVYFPKQGVEPGKWASFQCEVDEVISGNVIPQQWGNQNHIMVSGRVPELNMGVPYYIQASHTMHPKYGSQYSINRMEPIKDLNTPHEQRRFLEHLLTEYQVNKLYQYLDEPFTTIQKGDIRTLKTVPGIGEKTAALIIEKYQDNFASSSVVGELMQYDLTPLMINKLIEHYGSAATALQIIQENPYTLMYEVDGIGWSKADAIASSTGIDCKHPYRIEAYVQHVLTECAKNGDTILRAGALKDMVVTGLNSGLTDEDVRQALYILGEKGIIYWDPNKQFVGLSYLKYLEESIAQELHRLMSATDCKYTTNEDCSEIIEQVEREQGWRFASEQLDAINLARQSPVSIITGVAGSGKSSVVYGVLRSLGDSARVAQTALSGRAASRLGELTHSAGSTIHRLLKYNPNTGFVHNADSPIDYDIVVLDEVSMVDAELFLHLIKAIPTGCKLIMLGDDGQLESIGYCNIFQDMLTSGEVPVYKLETIHRQAMRSAIVTEGLKIRTRTQITPPYWIGRVTLGELQDLTLDVFKDNELTQSEIIATYKAKIAQGVHPKDIQILTPTKLRGSTATREINQIIQEYINPASNLKSEVTVGDLEGNSSYTLRLGDLVIATKNNYNTKTTSDDECPIYNGNRGVIKRILPEENRLIVDFEQWGEIVITKGNWSTIDLAYALTCHKLQGSEAPHVIVGFDTSAYTLLTKEWLYTAITRAREHCTICTTSRALSHAIDSSNLSFKHTRLKFFLRFYRGKENDEYGDLKLPDQ